MAVKDIQRLTKGDKDWTFRKTDLGNQVIDRLNRKYEVRFGGTQWKFEESEQNIVLIIPDTDKNFTPDPFYVNMVMFPDGKFRTGVFPNSYLFPDFTTDNFDGTEYAVGISNLLASQTPDVDDDAWMMLKTMLPDKVWLEIPTTGPLLPSIKSLGNGDDWNGGKIEYAYDGGSPASPIQQFARIPLCDIVAGDDGTPRKKQYTRTHLRMETAALQAKDNAGENQVYCDATYAYPA